MHTACDIAQQVAAGQLRASDVLAECLGAIDEFDDRLHAFISVDAEQARQQARAVDERVARGESVGVLAGVPVALKDNICTAWGRTTCGSRMLENYQSPFNAFVVQRLLAADAVLVGKTSMDEFAMGSSTENTPFGPAYNPWDPTRVCGGSSGGSAAAVSARLVPLALGSETGGSIRQPAAFCGISGLKPSYGRVSRFGLVAFGSSLDQIGPLAANVADIALVAGVICAHDPQDSTSVARPTPDFTGNAEHKPLRIGVPQEYFGEGLSPAVCSAVEAAIALYEQNGSRIVPLSMPNLSHAVACYYVVATAEASSNLARFDGMHFGYRSPSSSDLIECCKESRTAGFGDEVKRRIMLGTYALSSGYYDRYYHKALQVRTLIKQDFDRAFEQVDVIASPTSPFAAFKLGEKTADPLAMYLSDIYTAASNLAGNCAISVPCGLAEGDLPVGLQLQAPAFAEARLIEAAARYQSWTDWHTRRPGICHGL